MVLSTTQSIVDGQEVHVVLCKLAEMKNFQT